jgi:hypothetical protein
MTTAQMTRGSDGRILMFEDCDLRDMSAAQLQNYGYASAEQDRVVSFHKRKPIGDFRNSSNESLRNLCYFLWRLLNIPPHVKVTIAVGLFTATMKINHHKIQADKNGSIYLNSTRYRNWGRAAKALRSIIKISRRAINAN